MKRISIISKIVAALAIGVAFTLSAFAADHEHHKKAEPVAAGQLVPVGDKTDTQWLAKARAEFALESCPVSEEKFGSMGKPQDYIYQQAGKPDRLVRFCCKNCLGDFNKEPAKYLKIIDDAAAAKAKK
jgi:hypothetical protein